ncbi:hypothetical protein H2200_007044 [Cladophialophora chaetospira]|uniref:Zn(2)-C6 fungal-type domain-containing protein n=1 Tax=Cladophialophora chaetospira TaxID=386627 RepID=A0AA38X7I2_9EURO|nr:hypothetical protein H2200_007044 [Cladophialophora chaetospira]
MSTARHVEANHPLKGRLAYLPALLNPADGSGDRPMQSSPPGQKRRRPRAARACEFCRAKKYRCDEQAPCSRCKRRDQPCIYKDADLARSRFAHHDTVMTPTSTGHISLEKSYERRTPGPASHNDGSQEVSEINPHTLDTEFHGPTSSLAFLAAVQQGPHEDTAQHNNGAQSLVSAFHNESFSPKTTRSRLVEDQPPSPTRYHFRQSRFFLDGYFQNLHYIHPIINKADFLSRCEDLWFGRSEGQSLSFVALYYAVMSLGAIIQEWDEEIVEGMGRFEWARAMFHLASDALESTLGHNDLHTVQACIILAKVCQNELNPHLAYLYLGRAVRTALSAGFNRRPRQRLPPAQPTGHSDIVNTWWGLYSLEVEVSFALGRPDALGLDVFHNQNMPPTNDNTEHCILTPMVEFARIIRKVSISIYMSAYSLSERLANAAQIEPGMDAWIESVPVIIRPSFHGEQVSVMSRETKWARKQKHTLKLRYFNVKMVLYRPFLIAAAADNVSEMGLQAAVIKCVSAARDTIQMMHHMYCEVSYFRTWWYNVTYTMYAASILLCYQSRLAVHEETEDLQRHVSMAVDVLEAMEQHVVAKKAMAVLRDALQHKDRPMAGLPQQASLLADTPLMQLANLSAAEASGARPADEAFDPFLDVNFDMGQFFPFDDNYISPWTS